MARKRSSENDKNSNEKTTTTHGKLDNHSKSSKHLNRCIFRLLHQSHLGEDETL